LDTFCLITIVTLSQNRPLDSNLVIVLSISFKSLISHGLHGYIALKTDRLIQI
jgi:hypothetical protein